MTTGGNGNPAIRGGGSRRDPKLCDAGLRRVCSVRTARWCTARGWNEPPAGSGENLPARNSLHSPTLTRRLAKTGHRHRPKDSFNRPTARYHGGMSNTPFSAPDDALRRRRSPLSLAPADRHRQVQGPERNAPRDRGRWRGNCHRRDPSDEHRPEPGRTEPARRAAAGPLHDPAQHRRLLHGRRRGPHLPVGTRTARWACAGQARGARRPEDAVPGCRGRR